MVDVMNFANKFKTCRRKAFEAYFCKTPAGGCLLDPLKDSQIIEKIGKIYLEPKEVKHIKECNPSAWLLIRDKLITANDFILSVNGVLSKVTFADLNDNYEYPDGSGISKQSILVKSYICEVQFDVLTPISMTFYRAIEKKKGTAQQLEQLFVMKWVRIISKSNVEELALPVVDDVKANYKDVIPSNGMCFIVTEVSADGQPLREKMRFVDDKTFSYMYDNRGWQKYCTNTHISRGIPEPLFQLGKSINTTKGFADNIIDYIESNYIDSFANKLELYRDFDVKKINDDCACVEFVQIFEHAAMICFIWCMNSRYYLSMEYKDYYNEVFDGDVKKHLSILKENKCILLNESDFQLFKELMTALLCLNHSSLLSNYFTANLTSNEFMNLKEYTGLNYTEVNAYLRGEKSANNFQSYIRAIFISDILSRCLISKDTYHFRGMSLPKSIASKVKEGYVLENHNFLSATLSTPVAFSFGAEARDNETGYMVLFKNTSKQHGMYLNSISYHRNLEYEVLFDVNYDLKFIRKLSDYGENTFIPAEVWLCELVYANERGIKKYQYQKDATEKLLYKLQQDKVLMKNFYIEKVDETQDNKVVVELCRYNSKDVMVRVTLLIKEHTFKVEFAGSIVDRFEFSIKEKGYDYLFSYIHYVMRNCKGLPVKMDKSFLDSFSERFMYDLTSLFLNNNFIITNQIVNKNAGVDLSAYYFQGTSIMNKIDFSNEDNAVFDSTVNMIMPVTTFTDKTVFNNTPDEVISSEFTVIDTDLKSITFNLDICKYSEEKIKVELEAIDTDIRKEFTCPFNERLDLYEKVYLAIVSEFNLDCTRRLKRIFSIISGYHQEEIKFHKREQGKYVCYLGSRMFECTMQGSQITVELDGKSVNLEYFDSVYDSASLINTIL